MKIRNKILIITAFLIITNILLSKRCLAIGEFSIGINGGATSDPNNLKDEITYYNTRMRASKENNTSTKISQINIPFCFVYGINIRYQFNFILIRMGCHFSKPSYYKSKGSITPSGGEKNIIRITTYQNSIPFSMGIIIPLKERTFFFIGAGFTFHQAYVKITQSNPDTSISSEIGISQNRRNRYFDAFPGYHILIGMEIPVNKKMTISTEWIHQSGTSHPLSKKGHDNDGNTVNYPKRTINVNGDFMLLGINYYINF